MHVHTLTILILLHATTASAQNVALPGGGAVNITDIIVHERTARGRINACELEYKLWFFDHMYRRGEPVALIGSVMFASGAAGHQPVLSLKVRGRDFIKDQFVPFDISYAYIKTDRASYAGKEGNIFQCEGDGACVAYAALTHPELVTAIPQGFSIVFTRTGGNTDVALPSQAEDPKQSFFHVYTEGRQILDAEVWIRNSVIPFPLPYKADISNGEKRKTVDQKKVESATEEWRRSRGFPGQGNDRFFRYALDLRNAGLELSEIESKLGEEAMNARTPSERRAQIPSIISFLNRWGRRAAA